jgi:hypothetical protein
MLTADPNVKVVAVADAFEDRTKAAIGHLQNQFGPRCDVPPERAFAGLDAYQKAIAAGVDVVILATPPGFRPSHYQAAVEAGRHVFMEKPCCVDAPGFRTLMAANKLAEEKNLKVGVGLQRRHESSYLGGVQQIQDGRLGKFMFSRVYWNGGGIWFRPRTAGETEMHYQVRNWYHFVWLSGDNICEQHVHNLDVGNWVKGDHPVEANGMGACIQRYKTCNPQSGSGQIFDTHFVEFTYKDGTKMYSQCRQINNTWTSVSETIHGAKGTGGVGGQGPKLKFGNPYQQEHYDLLQAIRGGAKYHEGWHGATSSFTAVLGRMATYSGQIVKWDDAVAGGVSDFPDKLDWNAPSKVVPDERGNYPIPIPGVYKPY